MDLLRKLMDTDGISGDEGEVRHIIMQEIKKHVDDCKIDEIGNLIAHKKGEAPKVMLAAHMDEIGLMVKNIDDDGNIYFSRIGYIDPWTMLTQRVKVKVNSSQITGVITTDAMSNNDIMPETLKVDELYIDTGLTKEELTKSGVNIGTFIALIQDSGYMANDEIIYGKALDDRVGCYILLELAKKLRKIGNEMFFVFTVQEEIGLYGAKISAYTIKPDWAVAVDVTGTEDKGRKKTNILGKGPCITLKDAGMITNKCMNNWLSQIAAEKKIPYQIDVNDKGTTDALSISLSRGGVPSTVLSVPVRNIHSTIGMAHIKDIENAIKLLEILLMEPPKVCLT